MLLNKQALTDFLTTIVNNYKKYIQPRIYLIFSILMALFLALRPVPWATDDINYLDYVNYSGELLVNILNKPLGLFVDEPLWLLLNAGLGLVFENEMAFRIIIFLSSYIALRSLGLLSNNSLLTLFLFIIVGEILAKYILHIRQGLAISLFLLGLAKEGKKGTFIRMLTPFIHTSFWIVVFYEIFERILKKMNVSITKRILLFSFLNMAVILLLPFLATLMNDRRVELYSFTMASDASGNGFIFWIVLGICYFLFVKKDHLGILGCYGIIFYLESYFFLEFSARILENFLPIIVICIINSKKERRVPLLIGLLIYGALGWYFRGGLNF